MKFVLSKFAASTENPTMTATFRNRIFQELFRTSFSKTAINGPFHKWDSNLSSLINIYKNNNNNYINTCMYGTIYIYIYIYIIHYIYMYYILYGCHSCSLSGHKWYKTHRVLKSDRSRMGVIHMQSSKQCALPIIITMTFCGNSCTCHKAVMINIYIYI